MMPGESKRYRLWVLIGIDLLLVFALMALLTNCWDRESYPRLVPWGIDEIRTETELWVRAQSYACVLDNEGNDLAVETFDRVDVYETSQTVIIETWLGPSERKWRFWRKCQPAVGYGFLVQVQLESPLGNRVLIDPACYLDRYAGWGVCLGKGTQPRA